jgi:hypothetical protein
MAIATTATRPRVDTHVAEVVVDHQTRHWGPPIWSADEPVQVKASPRTEFVFDRFTSAMMFAGRE